MAPLLAERVAKTELVLYEEEVFRDASLDEALLLDLHRRLYLPRVVLAPRTEEKREVYFRALEAADHSDWQPLVEIWKDRLTPSSR